MSDAEAQLLLERLAGGRRVPRPLRGRPAGAARAAGFGRFADDLAAADGQPLQALDVRESRSSLAGAMVAAAAEGFALLEGGGGLFGVEDAHAAARSGSGQRRPSWDPDWYGIDGQRRAGHAGDRGAAAQRQRHLRRLRESRI